MNIIGVTVSVNYSELLAKSIDRWKAGCTSLIVVTSPDDVETGNLCRAHDVVCFPTDAFTRNGEYFNKGAAIAEAYEKLGLASCDAWILFFDADVCPPHDWKASLLSALPGFIYGATRIRDEGSEIVDRDISGYFMLFHASDHNAQRVPIVETHWTHAGNYDTEFQARWDRNHRVRLPLMLTHFGEPSQNWFGRGREDLMARMLADRRRRGLAGERIG